MCRKQPINDPLLSSVFLSPSLSSLKSKGKEIKRACTGYRFIPSSCSKCGRQAVIVSVSHGCLSVVLPPFLAFSLKSNEKNILR